MAIIAVVIVLVGGAIGAAWLYFRLNPDAWDQFLTDMQGEQTSASAPRRVARPARQSARLVASGNIEAEEVVVAAETGGRIAELLADEGDTVAAGETLVRIDQTMLLAQRDQAVAAVDEARAALDAARAQLELTRAGARPEEIAAAEGSVAEAQAGLDAATGELAAAATGVATAQAQLSAAKVAKTDAEAFVKAAQAHVEGAEAQYAAAQAGVDQIEASLAQARVLDLAPEIAAAQVGLERARIALSETQDEYDKALDRPWEDQSIRDTWAKRLKQAQLDYELAQSELDRVQQAKRAYTLNLTALEAQVEQAKDQLTKAGIHGAEAQLAEAQTGVAGADIQITQAESGVEAAQAAVTTAQAGVQVAQARLDRARAALDLLESGARAQEIALLEANVVRARAGLSSAEAALQALDVQIARRRLTAPVGGVVLERTVHAGELAAGGAPLLTVANLDQVTLTVYVPEADLGEVALGQEVGVTVDAYPDSFAGVVSYISSQAEFTPKNVQTQEERVHMVFAVKVRLENAAYRLKPGMPADAAFQ
jgi:HlyD family secretion protein